MNLSMGSLKLKFTVGNYRLSMSISMSMSMSIKAGSLEGRRSRFIDEWNKVNEVDEKNEG